VKERSLTIAVDCDDVLVPTARDAVEYYNTTYGTNVDLTHFYGGTPEDWFVDDIATASRRIEEYHMTLFEEAPAPYPEAIIAIKSLARVHKLYLVTGRADFLRPVTKIMADTHFLDCFQGVIHTSYFTETGRSKGEVCREIGAHALIDDGLMHCESAVIEGGVESALLLDQPWNQCESLHSRIIRCMDWDAVLREVDNIARC